MLFLSKYFSPLSKSLLKSLQNHFRVKCFSHPQVKSLEMRNSEMSFGVLGKLLSWPPKAIPVEALGWCEGHTFEDIWDHKTHGTVGREPAKMAEGSREGSTCVGAAFVLQRPQRESRNQRRSKPCLDRMFPSLRPAAGAASEEIPTGTRGCELGWGEKGIPLRAGLRSPGLAQSSRASTVACGTGRRFPKAKGHHAEGQATPCPRSPPDISVECKEKWQFLEGMRYQSGLNITC